MVSGPTAFPARIRLHILCELFFSRLASQPLASLEKGHRSDSDGCGASWPPAGLANDDDDDDDRLPNADDDDEDDAGVQPHTCHFPHPKKSSEQF